MLTFSGASSERLRRICGGLPLLLLTTFLAASLKTHIGLLALTILLVLPTLLGMLNINYDSRFIGHDVLHSPTEDDRAFISTCQSLGYLKHGMLTLLQPRRQVAACAVEEASNATSVPVGQQLLKEAIAYYQGTSELVKDGKYRSLQ